MGFGDLNLGVSDAIQSTQSKINQIAGLSLLNNTIGATSPILPWSESSIKSTFFLAMSIDPTRWDSLYPYRLMVIDSSNNKVVLGVPPGGAGAGAGAGAILGKDISLSFNQSTSSPIIQFLSPSSVWIFQLPITPQQLSITDQYAIQTSATLRGILEEHSGLRFKLIAASGTMGVWNQRSSVTKPPTSPSSLQTLFAGTIQAFGNVVNQVQGVINTITTGHPANKPTSLRPETSDAGYTSTGYYQALKLQQFLEQYAEAKRNPNCSSWRLVFDIPKQNQSFVVTPIMYTWHQSANGKPQEILYNFQLKAWRRIDLKQTATPTPTNNQPIDPSTLQNILNSLNQAQQVCSASLNLIGAVRSDIETPLNALRQTVLLVKGIAGVITTAADLPSQIVTDFKSSIASSINLLASTIKSNISSPTVTASVNSISAASLQFEGLSINAVANGQLGTSASNLLALNAINNIFSSPNSQFLLLDQVPLSSLSLTNAQQAKVQQIVTMANQTTVAQLKQYRGVIQQLALQLSNIFGSGSAYYNNLFGLPAPLQRILPITLDQYDILDSLYQVLSSYDILTASTSVDDLTVETNMEYVAGLADTANIEFSVPNSKSLAPVPFGLTIEGIAARYLGDAQRWIEIATLNNLREPYIDENGFQLPLLSNGDGRQVTVGSDMDLFVGQTVILNAISQASSPRTILDITQLSETTFVLTLDGLANLNTFTTIAKAYVQAYLPGTVNSQQKIFIPSTLVAPAESNIVPPPGTSGDPLTALSKVDWLLTDTGDIAVNNYGDFRYSSGITNIIQALRIKFGTQAGKLLLHPTFGLNVKPGSISSDLQIQDLYTGINNMVIQDPRFAGVSQLQITLNGPVLGISLAVELPGQTGVFPVSFALTSASTLTPTT
jgi:hypothetical protein